AMTFGGQHAQAAVAEREITRGDRLALAAGRATPGALAVFRPVTFPGDGYAHHGHDRPAVLDERDVDGKLPVALDEFLGAVERIDDEAARVMLPLAVAAGFLFLGDDRRAGESFRQAGNNDRVGSLVRQGQRTG